MKKAVAVHDICGFGKCSLTLALPILSAAGLETSVLPTALLSSHTGGLGQPFRMDLTNEMGQIISHWKGLGIKFDAVYCGYLATSAQAQIVSDFIDCFKKDGGIALIDPAMADNGKLYGGIGGDMPQKMAELCRKADVITPNITEALLLLGEKPDKNVDLNEIWHIAEKLAHDMDADVVITGVDQGAETGAMAYTKKGERISVFLPKIEGKFHGAGDAFASALIAKLANGASLKEAMALATEFTYKAIEATAAQKSDERFGLKFEACLPIIME